jgi:Xaa-Pro dipeptidase
VKKGSAAASASSERTQNKRGRIADQDGRAESAELLTMTTAAMHYERVNEIVIDADELDRRHRLIRASMAKSGIDQVIVYSTPLSAINVHYAANYDLFGDAAAVVVSMDADPILYVEEPDLERAARVSPIRDIRACSDFAVVCGTLLRREGATFAGLEWASSDFGAALAAWAGREVPSGGAHLLAASLIKTPVEQELIRQAAAIADAGFLRGFESLEVGMPEYVLAAEMEYIMRAKGAVDNFGLLSAGKHNRVIGIPSAKPIEEGDTLIFEITPARLGRNYSAQLCRTITVGPASKTLRDCYAIQEEALEAAMALVKPGALVCDITKAQDDVIAHYGFGDYCRAPYMRARGHGFGAGRIDLSRKNTKALEAGMSLIVHPNQYFPDAGYLALGEMIIVTETGVERLCSLRPGVFEKALAA